MEVLGRGRRIHPERPDALPEAGPAPWLWILEELGERTIDQVRSLPDSALRATGLDGLLSPARLVAHLVGSEWRSLSACYPNLPSPPYLDRLAGTRSEDLCLPGGGDPRPLELLELHQAFRAERLFPVLGAETSCPAFARHPWFPEPRWLFAHLVWHWSYHSGQIGLLALQSGVDYRWRTAESSD